jgi:hypothetical protein
VYFAARRAVLEVLLHLETLLERQLTIEVCIDEISRFGAAHDEIS